MTRTVLIVVVVAVVLVVLAVALALILAAARGPPGAAAVVGGEGACAEGGGGGGGGGGDGDARGPRGHALGEALHDVRGRHGPEHALRPPPEMLAPVPVAQPGAVGGAAVRRKSILKTDGPEKKPAPRRPWTEYATWEALRDDEGAVAQYWRDVNRALGDLDLDWGGVRAELKAKVYDNREWAGRINLVEGKPKIVELRPSPFAVGEGPLGTGVAAIVPKELVAEIEAKPALFFFHTHPGEDVGSLFPSPIDFAAAARLAYTGRFAADLMISPFGVFMYGPNAAFRAEVWADDGPRKASLALHRKTADFLATLEGARSWGPWTLRDHASALARYQFDYYVFPTDRYAKSYYRGRYVTHPDLADTATILTYHQRIAELEKEIGEERTEEASRSSRASERAEKKVRFLL